MIGVIGQIARTNVVFSALTAAFLLWGVPATGQTTAPSTPAKSATTAVKETAAPTAASTKCKPADQPLRTATGGTSGSRAATMAGRRVVLHEDGTWQFPRTSEKREIDAVTDNGRAVRLTEVANATGCVERKWSFVGDSGGLIQIVVTRAITTDPSIHGNRDNCIPVIVVRNLNVNGLRTIITEIEFTSPDGASSSTSIMLGPLDHGEERERASAPLFIEDCMGLTGVITVPYCILDNDANCQPIIRASNRGVIPLTLGENQDYSNGRQARSPPRGN